jgi:hypothetical protein
MAAFKKSLILKVLLFVILLIIGDYYIGQVLDYLYFNSRFGKYHKLDYVISKSSEDILIFGNSHAECHYVPSIFHDSLNLNCFNAGFRNQDILFTYCIHESILKRYSPKLIILNIDRGMFYVDKLSFEEQEAKLSELTPFYNRESNIRKELENRSRFEKYKFYSSIYPFNSSVINLLKYYFYHSDNFVDGYYPLYGQYKPKSTSGNPRKDYENNDTVNEVLLKKLVVIANHFKSHHIQLIAVISPTFDSSGKIGVSLKKAFDKLEIPLFDYSSDSIFIHKSSYFSDNHHLNDSGAKEFSAIVAHDIKPLLKN